MLKLNVNRTFKAPVPIQILDEKGNEVTGEFSATFRIMPRKQVAAQGDKKILDVVLVDVHDIELFGDDDKPLTGSELLQAAKDDPSVSGMLVASYFDNIVKKPQSKT